MLKTLKPLLLLLSVSIALNAQPAHNEQILIASGGDAVAMDGEWAVVGDVANNTVRIYKLDYSKMSNSPMNMWDLSQTIDQSTNNKWVKFGTSVAMHGNYLVIGDPERTKITGSVLGGIYVGKYDTVNNTWERIKTRNGKKEDSLFGTAVGVHDNNDGTAEIVVGAPESSNTGGDTGNVYAYDLNGTNLTLNSTLDGTSIHSRRFGATLDIKGTHLIVGAPDEQTTAGNDFVGAAYTFDFDGAVWSNWHRIKEGDTNAKLGTHVAINSEGNVSLMADLLDTHLDTFNGSVWLNELKISSQEGGDVDIDDEVYLIAQAKLRLNFFTEDNGVYTRSLNIPLSASQTDAFSSVTLYKEQVIGNDPLNDQVLAYDIPCGIKPGYLKADEWAMVSVPCGDGTASIASIFTDIDDVNGGCSTDGQNGDWAIYRQTDGTFDGTKAQNELMPCGDPMLLGKSYWIISDNDKSWHVNDTVVSTRTSMSSASSTQDLIKVAGNYRYSLPDLPPSAKHKVMVGNPFSRVVKWAEVKSVWNSGFSAPGTFFDSTAYVYDVDTPDIASGQNYRGITANGTPGFKDEIKPYQGFWILQHNPGDTTTYTNLEIALPFEK